MQRPIIVFDLDGTLIDTAPDLLDSLNHSLAAGSLPAVDSIGFKGFVGHGGRVMIERAFAARQKALALEEHDRLHALFVDHYTTNIPGKSRPYPGVLQAIARFEAAGGVTFSVQIDPEEKIIATTVRIRMSVTFQPKRFATARQTPAIQRPF